MKRGTLFFLGTGTLTLALAAASSVSGCQGNSGTGITGGAGGQGGDTPTTSTGSNTTTTGSNTTTTGSNTTTSGTGGSASVPATIEDITTNKVGLNTLVKLSGVVAMSSKFLVVSNDTSCLWGVMLSAPGLTETAKNTGIVAVSYGTKPAYNDAGKGPYCPTIQKGDAAGDGFPDDVKPGDVLDVVGKVGSYIPSTCGAAGETAIAGLQLTNIFPGDVTRTSTGGPVPTPHALASDEVTKLAAQTDMAFYRAWSGVKVRLEDVKPQPVTGPDGGLSVTGDFGVITLQDSNVKVGDKLYYHALLNSLKDPCHMGPHYADTNVTFTHIDGFVYLNYCTWDLEPTNRCVDLAPPSDDCAGNTCQ
ncbi:hypothetical protein A7982_12091 [Minicystis rosea]|nr:hypothetical protein A7982_12091 [Minicystis rosea]